MSFKIESLDYDFVRIGAIGDGSCMFHSILQGFNKSYINSSVQDKIKTTRQFRNDLSEILDEEINGKICYNQLSRGKLEEFSKMVPETSIENMKRSLSSNQWGDIRFLELISNVLNIDIFVIWSKTKEIYNLGDKDLYYKNRDSIVILNSGNIHFDTIGLKTENGNRTLFGKNEPIIKQLRSKLV
tara:strand:- start:40 stop:594 length:555 start_codon:yes stop_codon:yes gene_type:complete